jgi:uncharacterized protein with HEPN domain
VRDQRVYVLHAVDAVDAILAYTIGGREAFFADRKTQDAVIRNIEIVGQAVKGLSEEARALEPAVPWRQIAGMRDKSITAGPAIPAINPVGSALAAFAVASSSRLMKRAG